MLTGLILYGAYEENHSCCEFMESVVLSCPVFLQSSLTSVFTNLSLPPLLPWYVSLVGSGYGTEDQLMAEHSTDVHVLYFNHLSFSVSHHLLHKETYWMESVLIYGYRNTFSKIIVHPWRPTSSPTMGSWPDICFLLWNRP